MRKVCIKEEVCIGCGLCEVYCKTEHSQSKDLIKVFKRESPPPLPDKDIPVFVANCPNEALIISKDLENSSRHS